MTSTTIENTERVSSHGTFETILYALTSISLFGTVFSPLLPIESRNMIVYGFLGLFAFLLFIYSYYTITSVVRINESQGKTSYFGISLFYTGFIAVLWSVLAWSIQGTTFLQTRIPAQAYEIILLPTTHPTLLYSGLGVGVFGLFTEITNFDEFVISSLIRNTYTFLKGVYTFLAKTSGLGALIVFILGVMKTPSVWPYSKWWFGILAGVLWLAVFSPRISVKLWNSIKKNYRAIFNALALFLFIRALFEPDTTLRNYYFLGMILSFIIGNYKPLFELLVTFGNGFKALFTGGILSVTSSVILLIGLGVFIASFYMTIPVYYGLGIMALGIALYPKKYYNGLVRFEEILQEKRIKPLFSLILFAISFLLVILGLTGSNKLPLWWGIGFFIAFLLINISEMQSTYKFLRVVLPQALKYITIQFKEILIILRLIISTLTGLFLVTILLIPQLLKENTPYYVIGAIVLLLILENQAVRKNYKRVLGSFGFTISVLTLLDYLATRDINFAYISGASFAVFVIVNSNMLVKQIRDFAITTWKVTVYVAKGLYHGIIRFLQWVSNHVVFVLYFILEILLLIYGIVIIFFGDPLNVFPLRSFADRLSMGIMLIFMALTAFILLTRKTSRQQAKRTEKTVTWRKQK